MACCPRGVYHPFVTDCNGNFRVLRNDETIRAALAPPVIIASATLFDINLPALQIIDDNNVLQFEIRISTSGNTLLGKQAGAGLTTGIDNTFIGNGSGDVGQGATVTNTIGIGKDVVTTVNHEIIIGNSTNTKFSAGTGSTFKARLVPTADENLCLGENAFLVITTGVSNLAYGFNSSRQLTEGNSNVSLGAQALQTNLVGSQNVGVGRRSLFNVHAGQNVGVGTNAGRDINLGIANIFIGDGAGYNGGTGQVSTVDNTMGIGQNVVTTVDDQIIIGNASHDNTYLRGILEVTAEPTNEDQLWDDVGVVRLSDGSTRDRFFEEYAAGTVYTLTNTAAAVVFGTTSPIISPSEPGTYRISGSVTIEYVGATFVATQDVTLTLRRTNNTPANLADGTTIYKLQIVTTLTGTAATIYWEASQYATTNTDDSLTIFADVAATPSAGSVTISAASIKAEMILL